MDKNLKEYEKFIKSEIDKFKVEFDSTNDKTKIKELNQGIKNLYQYHQDTIRNFQHERLIHLIVTFFFGGLLLISIAAPFVLTLLPFTYNFSYLTILIFIICIILLITEIFYIRYYYELENGTQRLYKYSKNIFDIINRLN